MPTGKPTFSADLVGPESPGKGVIADVGFSNPRTVPGTLYVHSEESITFEWKGLGSIRFQRLDPREWVLLDTTRGPILVRTGPSPEGEAASPPREQPPPPSASTPPSRADIVQWATPSVVYIQTERGSGSGFAIGGGVVTNFHVVAGATRIVVLASGSRPQQVFVVHAYDANLDLAILEVTTPIPSVRFANVTPRVGEELLVMGYPQGAEVGIDTPTLTGGMMSAWRRGWIQFDAAISPGSSGGPVFNERGEVVGVATLKHLTAEGVGLAVPSSLLQSLFDNPSRMTVEHFAQLTAPTN